MEAKTSSNKENLARNQRKQIVQNFFTESRGPLPPFTISSIARQNIDPN